LNQNFENKLRQYLPKPKTGSFSGTFWREKQKTESPGVKIYRCEDTERCKVVEKTGKNGIMYKIYNEQNCHTSMTAEKISCS